MKDLKLTIETGVLDFDNLSKEVFTIEYIAKVINNIYRFGASSDITVLAHSINVYYIVEYLICTRKVWRGHSLQALKKAALLHEISEAAGLGDIITPIKTFLGKKARKRIDYIEQRLCELYNVTYPFPDLIHKADRYAYVYEVVTFLDKKSVNYCNHIDWSVITTEEIIFVEEFKKQQTISPYHIVDPVQHFLDLYEAVKGE